MAALKLAKKKFVDMLVHGVISGKKLPPNLYPKHLDISEGYRAKGRGKFEII